MQKLIDEYKRLCRVLGGLEEPFDAAAIRDLKREKLALCRNLEIAVGHKKFKAIVQGVWDELRPGPNPAKR